MQYWFSFYFSSKHFLFCFFDICFWHFSEALKEKQTADFLFPARNLCEKLCFIKSFQYGKWFTSYLRSECVLNYCQNCSMHDAQYDTTNYFLILYIFCPNSILRKYSVNILTIFLKNARLCFFHVSKIRTIQLLMLLSILIEFWGWNRDLWVLKRSCTILK